MPAQPRLPLRIVKVGGSLLDYSPLPAALAAWLTSQSPAVHLLLAGGGDWAEAIRAADRRFGLGEGASHDLCLQAMGITARLLAALVPESRVVHSVEEVQQVWAHRSQAPLLVFDPAAGWPLEEPHYPGPSLPRQWSVTSDSIAARLAQILGGDELVLLKSASPPLGELSPENRGPRENRRARLEWLSRQGYVDAWFPTAAAEIAGIRLVNLRSGEEVAV